MYPTIIKGHLRKQYKISINTKTVRKLRHRVQKNTETVLEGGTHQGKSVRLVKISPKGKDTWVGFVVENDKVIGVVKPNGLGRYANICRAYDEKYGKKVEQVGDAPNTSNKNQSFKHTKHRLEQRFHLNITETEYNAVCEKLANPSFKKLKGNLVGMWYKCKWVVFAWDATKKIIRTAYPAYSNNAFGKAWHKNSQKPPFLYRLFTPQYSVV